MNVAIAKTELTQSDAERASAAIEAARSFASRIAELAPKMHADRKMDDALMADMEKAGLFSLMVPKRWGGAGLGPDVCNTVCEIIGRSDMSTGWVTGFYILHNWVVCRFPLEVQEILYKDRTTINTPIVFGPPGTAERVEGGYKINGRWPYSSGAWHGSYGMVPAMVDSKPHWFLVPREELEYVDDWYMEGMTATGSITMLAKDVFVADKWHAEINSLVSVETAPGAGLHDDLPYQLPFSALLMVSLSPALGALDRAVEICRERLETSRPNGNARMNFAASRVRWVEAYEAARVLRLVRDDATAEMVNAALNGEAPNPEREARAQLHLMHFIHGVKDAVRKLIDGFGTSSYKKGDPLFRIVQDVSMLATHTYGPDYDTNMDRHARNLLGLGALATDPKTQMMEQLLTAEKK